jgi:hypothetical protein
MQVLAVPLSLFTSICAMLKGAGLIFDGLLPKAAIALNVGSDAFPSIPRLPAWSFQGVTDG